MQAILKFILSEVSERIGEKFSIFCLAHRHKGDDPLLRMQVADQFDLGKLSKGYFERLAFRL
jgi:hypothetical protein